MSDDKIMRNLKESWDKMMREDIDLDPSHHGDVSGHGDAAAGAADGVDAVLAKIDVKEFANVMKQGSQEFKAYCDKVGINDSNYEAVFQKLAAKTGVPADKLTTNYEMMKQGLGGAAKAQGAAGDAKAGAGKADAGKADAGKSEVNGIDYTAKVAPLAQAIKAGKLNMDTVEAKLAAGVKAGTYSQATADGIKAAIQKAVAQK